MGNLGKIDDKLTCRGGGIGRHTGLKNTSVIQFLTSYPRQILKNSLVKLSLIGLFLLATVTNTVTATDCQLVVEFDRQYIQITKAEMFDVPSEYQLQYGQANFQASTNGRIRGINVAEKWIGHQLQNWTRRDGEPVADAGVYILKGDQWVKTSESCIYQCAVSMCLVRCHHDSQPIGYLPRAR